MNVYFVGFGMLIAGEKYDANIGGYNVLAKTAKEAIEKADKKLESGELEDDGGKWVEVFESVKFVLTIDIP